MLSPRGCHVLFLASLALCAHAGDAKPAKTPAAAPDAPAEPPAPKEFARPDGLVATLALAKELQKADGKLVVVDARGRAAFQAGHIPGAVNIESDALQDPERPPYFMPTPDALKKTCADAGIHAASRVVVYDEDDARLAARVWFTLHAYGHDRVSILDGGAGKWRAEGRAWAGGDTPPATAPGTFEPLAVPRGVCAFSELPQFRTRVHILGQLPPTTLLDARALPEYTGEDMRGKSGGHIPGAANIEWRAMLAGKERQRVWRSPPEIHAILRMAGVERERKLCVYDQAGGRSAHLYFTLWLMGCDTAVNYVAGWREYGNRDDVDIEK